MKLSTLIIVGLGIIIFSFVIVYSAMTFLTKKKKVDIIGQKQAYNKRFRFYYDFVLTRQMFRQIYEQIGSLAVYNMIDCRVQAVKFFERALISAGALFVVGFILLGLYLVLFLCCLL